MAFDGITIANIVHELNETILNGRIAKIAQRQVKNVNYMIFYTKIYSLLMSNLKTVAMHLKV